MHTIAYGSNTLLLTRLPRLFPVNMVLVREADGLTLVDTGIPGSAKGILAAAQSLGAPIRRVVLTHAHLDHVGGLDELRPLLGDVEVAISARDARLLAGDKSLDASEPQTPPKGSFTKVATTPTRLLHDGDMVGSLRVVAAPGHTPGHVALFDTRDSTLIAGDALQTRGGIAVSGTVRPFFPFPAFGTWHKPSALASSQRLLALQPKCLIVGHGDVIEQPAAAMARAIADAERALGKEQPHGA